VNDNPTVPIVRIRIEEVLALVEFALENDDVAGAMHWGALALSGNDSRPQGADRA
jgi:hypothetical protein